MMELEHKNAKGNIGISEEIIKIAQTFCKKEDIDENQTPLGTIKVIGQINSLPNIFSKNPSNHRQPSLKSKIDDQ